MTGRVKILYGFDIFNPFDEDKPYQARTDVNGEMVDAWATSFAEARQNLITLLRAMPEGEEVDL